MQLIEQLVNEINMMILNKQDSIEYKYDAFLPEDEILEKVKQIKNIDPTFELKDSTKQALREWLYWTYNLEQQYSSCRQAIPYLAYTSHKELYILANLGDFNESSILASLPHNYHLKKDYNH